MADYGTAMQHEHLRRFETIETKVGGLERDMVALEEFRERVDEDKIITQTVFLPGISLVVDELIVCFIK